MVSQSSQALTSVIIPVRNRFHEAKQAVQSVIEQGHPVEIIIVDESDTPLSMDDLGSPQSTNITIIRPTERLGIGGSRNVGLERATGSVIAFLDADDFWQPNFLSEMLLVLERQENCSGAIALSKKVFDPGIKAGFRLKLQLLNVFKDIILLACYVLHKRRLEPRAPFLAQLSHLVFTRVGVGGVRFMTDGRYGEDWRFVFEIMQTGSIAIVPRKILNFRYHPASNTLSRGKQNPREKLEDYRRFILFLESKGGSSLFLTLFKYYAEKALVTG